jgi:hypothetical protein
VNVTIPVRDPVLRLMNSIEAMQLSTWESPVAFSRFCSGRAFAHQAAAAFLRLASSRESTSATI